jgi:hypothetical protein
MAAEASSRYTMNTEEFDAEVTKAINDLPISPLVLHNETNVDIEGSYALSVRLTRAAYPRTLP